MSDLLIKNIELPKEMKDSYCLFVTPYNVAEFNDRGLDPDKPRHDVIVLPDHGDLIDKHGLLEKLRELVNEVGVLDGETDTKKVLEIVENAPVVLPKSGSQETR